MFLCFLELETLLRGDWCGSHCSGRTRPSTVCCVGSVHLGSDLSTALKLSVDCLQFFWVGVCVTGGICVAFLVG